jgi:peptide-methionine (S)-S-oxide reductase
MPKILLLLLFCLLTSPATAVPEKATLVLAGGCFWGVEAVYEHIKGVQNVISGYAGGAAEQATYDQVSSGSTSHAEAVQITYDPAQVSLAQLLDVYFTVAHNPTERNRQGPDVGTQYRSAVFYASDAQQKAVKATIAALESTKKFDKPIVTTLEPLKTFYPAEAYHQNYATTHPENPYIVAHDAPKVATLKKKFPTLYDEK